MNQAGKVFPHTGFKEANFNLIGSGDDQSVYRCEIVSGGSSITLSGSQSLILGEKCNIKFNSTSRPSEIVVKMQYKNAGTWEDMDTFTIQQPVLWAEIKGAEMYNSASYYSGSYLAAQLCDTSSSLSGKVDRDTAASYFFKPTDFSNAPNAKLALTGHGTGLLLPWTLHSRSRFSRDLDQTFLGEWGDLYDSYTNSGFSLTQSIWTSESAGSNSHFTVNPVFGSISTSKLNLSTLAYPRIVVCKR